MAKGHALSTPPLINVSEENWALNTFFLAISYMPRHACLSFLPHHPFAIHMKQKDRHENRRPANIPKCYY